MAMAIMLGVSAAGTIFMVVFFCGLYRDGCESRRPVLVQRLGTDWETCAPAKGPRLPPDLQCPQIGSPRGVQMRPNSDLSPRRIHRA